MPWMAWRGQPAAIITSPATAGPRPVVRLQVNVTHVPYRGGGPAANDLIGGQIDYMCLNTVGAAPLIMGKQVKAIATLSRSRSPLLPDLPTAHEQGLTGFGVVAWNAFFLPKGAPAEIVKRLNDATSQAMDTPAIKNRMHEVG